MKASEIASDFAENGFEGAEEIKIPSAMIGQAPPIFADTWVTFYEAWQEGDRVTFEIGEGVTWGCAADQEVEAR